MRTAAQLLALPASLLLLIVTYPPSVASEAAGRAPVDASAVKRNAEQQERLFRQPVIAVRKMSDDPGEMFFLDYWTYAPLDEDNPPSPGYNDSMGYELESSFPLHSSRDRSMPNSIPRYLRFALFSRSRHKRDYQCPDGSTACPNNPDNCCPSGYSCQIIHNGTLGNVGCCLNGQTCGGTLSSCPTGYNSCPNYPGGGCCVPGYDCEDTGCIATATETVYVLPTTQAISTPPSPTTNTIVPISTPTSVASSLLSTSKASSSPTSTTTTTTTTSSLSTVFTTSTPATYIPPAVPTSHTTTTTTATNPSSTSRTPTSTSPSGASCPTGYYACSAFYPSGACCQIGRDCVLTSCPAGVSTTVISTNSVTAVAPTGSSITGFAPAITGSCAKGWFSCNPAVGGGCCPSGYGCEAADCTATGPGGAGSTVGKDAPVGSAVRSVAMDFGAMVVVVAVIAVGL